MYNPYNWCRDSKTHMTYILGIIYAIIELFSFFVVCYVMITLCSCDINFLSKVFFGISSVCILTAGIENGIKFIELIKEYILWLKK